MNCRLSALLPLGLALSGCGSVFILVGDPDPLVSEAQTLAAKSETLAVSSALPSVDGVAMNGVMILGDDLTTSGERTIGDFRATADFASGSFTGSADDFLRGTFTSDGDQRSFVRRVAGRISVDSQTFSAGSTVLRHTGTLDIGGTTEALVGSGTGRFLGAGGDMFLSNGSVTTATSGTTLDVRIIAD